MVLAKISHHVFYIQGTDKHASRQMAFTIVSAPFFVGLSRKCVYVCTENVTSMTHPLPVQQQVDFEDHTVVHRNLLISVKDLKYPAEDGAVVHPRGAEAAFAWWETQRHAQLPPAHYIEQNRLLTGFQWPFVQKHNNRTCLRQTLDFKSRGKNWGSIRKCFNWCLQSVLRFANMYTDYEKGRMSFCRRLTWHFCCVYWNWWGIWPRIFSSESKIWELVLLLLFMST